MGTPQTLSTKLTQFLDSFPILRHEIAGNPLWSWAAALLLFLVLGLVLRALKRVIVNRLKAFSEKTTTDIDDLFSDLFDELLWFIPWVLAIFFSAKTLTLTEGTMDVLQKVVLVSFLIQFGIWGSRLGTHIVTLYIKRRRGDDSATMSAAGLISFGVHGLVWALVSLLTLDNLGVDVTALIAGLGVGGIAVALAVQNLLGDLLASLSIILDKPFEVGDFIIVGDSMGNVERIGIKTTRLRSLSGEQLVFSNSDLLSSRIRNYKRMYERRILFSIGVTYQTPRSELEAIPTILRELVEKQSPVRFDRAHFKEFGDSALTFEVVYFVLQPDYIVYMDIQQRINLELFQIFEERGIEFAYPTQTVFLEGISGESAQEVREEKSIAS